MSDPRTSALPRGLLHGRGESTSTRLRRRGADCSYNAGIGCSGCRDGDKRDCYGHDCSPLSLSMLAPTRLDRLRAVASAFMRA